MQTTSFLLFLLFLFRTFSSILLPPPLLLFLVFLFCFLPEGKGGWNLSGGTVPKAKGREATITQLKTWGCRSV